MPGIEEAVALAALAHAGQKDKAGEPYLLHPLRVMLRLAGEDARIIAVLHDAVEDTEVTLDDLRKKGFSEAVVRGVDALTRREGETYEAFIDRLAPDALARQVKLADLEDNMDLRRRIPLTPADFERLDRYWRAYARLKSITSP